jgi:signal transduction histidine kinase
MRCALAETQEAARAKAAFLAAMSHELKTPLNAVIGFSDIMRQQLFGPVGEERYRSYVADIHDNGRRLLAMINDILDLSRVEGRLLDLEESEVNVQGAVTAACNALMEDKPDAAAIHIDVAADLPLLKADPRRLHQILTHLLSNAVKFTRSDGHISVRSALTPQGGVAIAISDNGIGMDPDRIEHALEPFKQLDSRLARRFEGVGLGLPLANALVKAHDGALSIESSPASGTTVTVSFPAQRNAELARAACG